jgi:hypothetical protein
LSDERTRLAEELRRIREAVRERALLTETPTALPPAATVHRPEPLSREKAAPAEPIPAPPDGRAVNAGWDVRPTSRPGGWRGLVARLVHKAMGPTLDSQVAFNSNQVRFDNDLLAYVDARIDAVHRHYDAVLGTHGRHMGEIDERHLILQEELVAHVHDLVKRIDLVLSTAERGRLSLEFALRDVRARLTRLEDRLRRE